MTGPPLRMAWCQSATPGALVAGSGRLYAARLVGPGATCVLYDAVAAPAPGPDAPLLVALASATAPDDWPRIGFTVNFRDGLFPVFTGTGAIVQVWWERS